MSPGRPAPTVVAVRNVPWWGLLSSGAAPVLMVGGWMVAARLQPQSVDPVAETVSALAAVDAAERWVMTVTFLAVGVCYIATGLALRQAGAAGRLILVAGAGVGMLVAAFPQPADGGSLLHAIWASAGFVRAYGLASCGMAARLRGAVGAEAGGVCHRRRDACTPPGLVRRRGGHRRRPRRTGRTGPWRGPGGMAADGRPVLPSPGRAAPAQPPAPPNPQRRERRSQLHARGGEAQGDYRGLAGEQREDHSQGREEDREGPGSTEVGRSCGC